MEINNLEYSQSFMYIKNKISRCGNGLVLKFSTKKVIFSPPLDQVFQFYLTADINQGVFEKDPFKHKN